MALLNASTKYKINPKERKAVEEVIEESKKGNSLTYKQVLAEAKQKYSNLKFE